MINPIAAGASLKTASETGTSPPPGPGSLTNKETFLQLLVAQLRNQSPLNPKDGVEFLNQLAQFTQLEQSLQMRQDLSAIREGIGELVRNTAPAA